MSDAKVLLDRIKTIQAEITTVCLCHPETKKAIEQKAENLQNVILIENSFIEQNKILVVNDLEAKKSYIEMYKSRKEQK